MLAPMWPRLRNRQCASARKLLTACTEQVYTIMSAHYSVLTTCISSLTVSACVEVTRYLLKLPGVSGQCIVSERFSHDPLENHFGQVRASGGRCENPTARSCLTSAQSLRVQCSLALQPVRGNCSRKRRLFNGKETIDNEPVKKKARK